MSDLKRPETPAYLRQAVYRVFGKYCLRCLITRPIEVAHINDWPTCRLQAGLPIDDLLPPTDWRESEALRLFHDLGNVLPLCPNCHTLYDGSEYEDVDESEIRGYRDSAVLRTDVLTELIDFVGIELSGRPNRCSHKVAGKRVHARVADPNAVLWPLIWISHGYEQKALVEDPRMIVPTGDGWHVHVNLDGAGFRHCAGQLGVCDRQGWVWKRRSRTRNTISTPAPSP
jgi:hypothetical protein